MTKSGFTCRTVSSCKPDSFLRNVILAVAIIAMLVPCVSAQSNVQIGTKRLLGEPRSATSKFVAAPGAENAVTALTSGSARPLALIAADLYARGREDAIAGYATAKGGAIVIQSAKIVRGARETATPFDENALVINVPVTPDFIAVMDVNQDGRRDLVFGARGDSRLFIATQHGKSGFDKPTSIALPGALSALASNSLGSGFQNFLITGVRTERGGAIAVWRASAAGPALVNQMALPAVPSSFAAGKVDADPGKDLAAVAGGRVYIFHGNDVASGRAAQSETIPSNGTAVGIAIGTFLPHRGTRSQLAVLTSGGEVSVLTRGTLDFTPYTVQELRDRRIAMRTGTFRFVEPGLASGASHDGNWTALETIPTSVGASASLVTGRISGSAGEDIAVVSAEQSRVVLVSHGRSKGNAVPQATVTDTNLYSASNAVASMRVSADGRSGFVMLSQTGPQPLLALPPTSTTITVDTFNDTADQTPGDNNCDDGTGKCSLRAAIQESNQRNANDPSVHDTIVLPDGTYTLTLGQIDITAGMSIVGQSGNAANVIIDASGNGKAFSINFLGLPGFDTNISGLTITNGLTTAPLGAGGDGGGLDWDAGGTGTLTLSNVIVTNNVSLNGDGGGIFLSNILGGTGHANIADSIITTNLADDLGGGAFIGSGTQAFFNNVVMDDDHADNNVGDPTGVARGGGYYFFTPSGAGGVSEIHGGRITNSTAISDGGGIFAEVGLNLDAGSGTTLLIDSNSSGGNGGGIYQTNISENSNFSNLTVTNNTAGGNGPGIYETSTGGVLTMNFSRIALNQSSSSSTGLGYFNAASGSTTDVTRNWWACDTTPNANPCNAIDDSAAAVNATPWIVLSHVGAPNPISLGPSPDVTLTADFLKDSSGGNIAPASIPVLIGLPIAFTNATNGALSNEQTAIQPNGTATATLTVSAGPTASADAVVDGLAVKATITVQTANLSIAKTHTGNFQQGQTGAQYTITVSNSGAAGTAPTTGTVTVADTLPAGLTATAITGTGWTCTLGTLSCTRADVLAPGASYPAITLTVDVASNAAALLTNTVSVSGGSDPATKQANDPTTILVGADLTITKSHTGNFAQGQSGATYTVTVTNSGGASTIGTVTVVDVLPAGLTATGISGTGWNCTLGTLTCTRSDVLAAAASYPAITITVNVAANAAATITNTVTVAGGAEVNTGNDTASDLTTVNQAPDLTITKSHVGNFSQGQVGATYSLTVSNVGGSATSTTVSVTDNLPAGLTATAITGTGWTCTLATATCTRADALAAASAYPPITVTVNVAANAAASITNAAIVSGGGEVNLANDTATDLTTVIQLADLTVTKTHTGNFFQGQTGAIYTLTVKNVGTGTSSGTVTLTDTLPASLTATAISGTGWTCTLGTLTCTRADALAGAASYPAVTLTVNVSLTAPATATNTAAVSGGSDSNNANNTASDPTTITAPFTMTVTNANVTVPAGQNALFNLNLTYPTGASGTITFACSNVPLGATCVFSPAQVTMTSAGSSQVTLTIPTHNPASGTQLASNGKHTGALLGFAMFPAFGMVLLVTGRRKWLVRLGLVALFAIVALGFSACGGSPAPSQFTPLGTYNIGVTATTNTNLQVSTTVHMTVVAN